MIPVNVFGSPNAPSQVIPIHHLIQPQQLQGAFQQPPQQQQPQLIQMPLVQQQQPQQQRPQQRKGGGGKSRARQGGALGLLSGGRSSPPNGAQQFVELASPHASTGATKRVITKKKSTFYSRGVGGGHRGSGQAASAGPSASQQASGGGGAELSIENLGTYLRQRFANFAPSSEMLRLAAREYIGDLQHLDLASIYYMTNSGAVTANSFLGLSAAVEVKFGQVGLREHQMSRRIASALASYAALSAATPRHGPAQAGSSSGAGGGAGTAHHSEQQHHKQEILVFSQRLLANIPPRVVTVFGAEPPQQVDLVTEARSAKLAGTPDQCTNQLAVLLLKRCVTEERLRIVSAADSKHYVTLPETLRNAIFDVIACVCAVESEENFYESAQIHEATLRNVALSDFIQKKIQSFLHEHRRNYNHGKGKFVHDGKELVASMYEAHLYKMANDPGYATQQQQHQSSKQPSTAAEMKHEMKSTVTEGDGGNA